MWQVVQLRRGACVAIVGSTMTRRYVQLVTVVAAGFWYHNHAGNGCQHHDKPVHKKLRFRNQFRPCSRAGVTQYSSVIAMDGQAEP